MQVQIEGSMMATPIRVSMNFNEAKLLKNALKQIEITPDNCNKPEIIAAMYLVADLAIILNDPYFD